MTDVLQRMGQRVQALREERGVTIETLARDIGVSSSTVNRIQAGGQDVGIVKVAAIARRLSCSVDYLLGESESQLGQRGAARGARPSKKEIRVKKIGEWMESLPTPARRLAVLVGYAARNKQYGAEILADLLGDPETPEGHSGGNRTNPRSAPGKG